MKIRFTIRDLLWLLALLAMFLAWRIDRSRVPQWEYQYNSLTFGNEAAELDKLGAEGWEVCSYNFGSNQREVLLKRQKR